ncbi:MAG TPA: CHAT domain-containing tetratricopeptide repeat protein [Allosphingosinicella sp.]|nr:CHAT domain-containing tetratricopeptide repeat protein [Allosphingosinicella sp.]
MLALAVSMSALLAAPGAAQEQFVADIPNDPVRVYYRTFAPGELDLAFDTLAFWDGVGTAAETIAPAIRAPNADERRRYAEFQAAARAALDRGDMRAAEAALLSALRLQEATYGPRHPGLAGTLARLIVARTRDGRPEETVSLHRRLYETCLEALGPPSPCAVNAWINYDAAIGFVATQTFERLVAAREPAERLSRTRRAEYERLVAAVQMAVEGNGPGLQGALTSQAAFEEASFGPDSLRLARTRDALADLLHDRHRFAEAEALARGVVTAYQSHLPADHYHLLNARHNLVRMILAQGRSVDAEPIIAALVTDVRNLFGPHHHMALTMLYTYANTIHDLGRSSEAEPLLQETLRQNEALFGEGHVSTRDMRANYGQFLRDVGRFQEAEPLLRASWEGRDRTASPNSLDTIRAGASYAEVLRSLGREQEALTLTRDMMERQLRVFGEEHRDSLDRVHAYASALYQLGRFSEAEQFYEQAVRIGLAVRGRDHPRTRFAYDGLAAARLRNPARAHLALEPAREVWESVAREQGAAGFDLPGEAGVENWRGGLQSLQSLLADASWARGPGLRPEAVAAGARPPQAEMGRLQADAFASLQETLIDSTSRSVAIMAARETAGSENAALAGLIERRRELRQAWEANERARNDALARLSEIAPEELEGFRERRASLEAEAVAIDLRLRSDFNRYFAFVRPRPLTEDAARALLNVDEAVLMIVPTEFGTHTIAITGAGLRWSRSDMNAEEIRTATLALRADLDSNAVTAERQRGPLERGFDRRLAYRLYRELIEPVAPHIAGKTHLYVAVGGSLGSLPLGVLVTSPPTGRDDDPSALRHTDWFADAFALVQIPSLQSLQFLRDVAATRTDRIPRVTDLFFGFGDPLVDQPHLPAGYSNAPALPPLPRLPGSGTEIEELRNALGAPQDSVFLRGEASERRLRTLDISRTRVLAFATHAVLAGQRPGIVRTSLLLTPGPTADAGSDGLLTTEEISTLRISADLVVLSACNTAAAESGSDEGLTGLAQAFFYAGARALLASHWRVRDDLAARTTIEMFDGYIRGGLSRAQALQRSMRRIREDEDEPRLAHPAAWAAFSLVGDGRR